MSGFGFIKFAMRKVFKSLLEQSYVYIKIGFR